MQKSLKLHATVRQGGRYHGSLPYKSTHSEDRLRSNKPVRTFVAPGRVESSK
jgi:hypothetical protein